MAQLHWTPCPLSCHLTLQGHVSVVSGRVAGISCTVSGCHRVVLPGRPWPSYTDTAPSVLPPTTTRTRVSLSVRVGVSADHVGCHRVVLPGARGPATLDTVPSVLPPTTTRTRVSLSVRVGVSADHHAALVVTELSTGARGPATRTPCPLSCHLPLQGHVSV